MPLKLYPRPNGIWHIRGTVQTERFDRSARTRDRAEAEQIRAQWEADAFRRAVYGERAVATFAEGVIAYVQAGGSRDHLAPILQRIGSTRLTEINQAAVDKLAREMKPAAAPATLIRQVYTPVLAVLNHAAGQGLCNPVRLKKPRVRSKRTEWLTPDEVEAWLGALPDHLRRLVTFYVGTGCRASEALALDWRDVSPKGERVTFWETKAGYARSVDLPPRVRDALPERGTGPVFRNMAGEPWHGYDAINLALRRLGQKRPELHPAHCHLFRHTWATWAYAVTHDLTFLMGQGGWRSATMVMRYTHAGTRDLAEWVRRNNWEIGGSRNAAAH